MNDTPLFSDSDMKLRMEMREIISKQKSPLKKIITDDELLVRRKFNLPCDNYVCLSQLEHIRKIIPRVLSKIEKAQ